MGNIVRLACLSLIQLVSIVVMWLVASLYGFRGIDPDNVWIMALVVGTFLGVIYMSWWRKGPGIDVTVLLLSPMISNEVLSQNSHWLSPMFPGYLMYGVVALLIWVGIAVVMRVAFAGVQRFFS